MGTTARRNGKVVDEIGHRSMTNVTNLTGEKLAEIIAHRHACLTQMHALGVKQAELVKEGDIGALLRLLSVKNQLIAVLQTIEQQLGPFHSQDPEKRSWSNPAARERCVKQAAECQQLLNRIMELERDSEQKMTDRRDQVANQLQAVQFSGAARRAYQLQQRGTPRAPVEVSPNPEPMSLHTEA